MNKHSAAIFTLCILLIGCSVPKAASVPSSDSLSEPSGSSPSQSAVADDTSIFIDISGKPFAMEDIKSIRLNYAMGWNFDNEGYVTIRSEDVVGNCIVTAVSSNYYLQYYHDPPPALVCDQNDYLVECQEELAGVLQVSGEGIKFFPYDNPGNNFLFLSDRKVNELYFSRERNITGKNGDIKVQPIGISIWLERNEVAQIPSLGDAMDDTLRNYDADIKFTSILFSTFSHGEGDKVFGARTIGNIQSMDSIVIHEQL